MVDLHSSAERTNECTIEIERVKKNGGSGTVAFVRKQAKKVAGYTEYFSKQLKEYNIKINNLWDEIEKNIVGLIENRFVSSKANRKPLIKYLSELNKMKSTVTSSKEAIDGFISTLDNNIGLERSMNQAIRFVKEDLLTYKNVTDRIGASIEKILSKARFVVGDIDYSSIEQLVALVNDLLTLLAVRSVC